MQGIIGVIIGLLGSIYLHDVVYKDKEVPMVIVDHYREVIDQCELNLSRTQHCEIVAIVIENGGGTE